MLMRWVQVRFVIWTEEKTDIVLVTQSSDGLRRITRY
jgi:hypothetical protein